MEECGVKRIIAALAALLLLSTACAESYSANVWEDDGTSFALLLDAGGEKYTLEAEYAIIYPITDDGAEETLFCAVTLDSNGEYESCALLNEHGEELLGRRFQSLESRKGVVLATEETGYMSALDAAGNDLLTGEYGWIEPNGEGGYLALKVEEAYDPDSSQFYPVVAIDAKGEETETGVFSDAWSHGWYSEGLCRVQDGHDSIFCYLDAAGKEAFRISEDYADDFQGGHLICVDSNSRYRLLNPDGSDALGKSYASISYDSSLGDEAKFILIDDHGAIYVRNPITLESELTIAPCGTTAWSATQSEGELLMVWYDDRSRIYDLAGKLLFENMNYSTAEVTIAYSLVNDGSVKRFVRASGVWPNQTQTLLDETGRSLGEAHRYLDGLRCESGAARFLITEYETEASGGAATIAENTTKYGVCDESGEVVLPAEYDWIEMLAWNRYWVCQDKQWGMIDESGRWLATVEMPKE